MAQDVKTNSAQSSSRTESVLKVRDLAETIDFFTTRLGFRLEMIVPADAPQTALVSGRGVTMRLESHPADALSGATLEVSAGGRAFIISRMDADNVWVAGRAGMQYRDLIPGRMGGRIIASHIRIPNGGETPDYVHYHKVRFQMIFCNAGWARVVYEDQGPPFVLEAGDCVLQPPEIRHRVLESSPGLEVIEIGTPATHETWADHELELPTRDVLSERLFAGQRFVRHRAGEANWIPSAEGGFDVRDTGIREATNGLATVRVLRFYSASTLPAKVDGLLFLFILRGTVRIVLRAQGVHQLHEGDSIGISSGSDYELRAEKGLEMLEVSLPEVPSALA
ncbi:MAG: cupin domain-containing protein [Acidobacteriota bacterium]